MKRQKQYLACTLVSGIAIALLAQPTLAQAPKAHPPKSLRLYVFDCGKLNMPDLGRYELKKEEVVTNYMSVPCFLVAHPKGTLMWDVGVIPDKDLKPDGVPATLGYAIVSKSLKTQMAQAGYSPADIDYLALSHFHYDHVANANDFARATWLVRKPEWDIMFADPPSERTVPANYTALKTSKTITLKDGDYDVFGDGTVVIKPAPGHSPAHQVLFLKMAKTGPVLLSGDLYHYPEERRLHRFPKTEFNKEQTAASRAEIEAFLKKSGAKLWIQHDFTANAKLKKSPDYYE
jgi:glyoxylase-like metal-dependent hydrolase (beta-lactamase superfamily II)